MRDVALVNMPFADRRRPSFALSQLAALVNREFGEEVNVRVCYLNHDFVRFFGTEIYDAIAEGMEQHVAGIGDWLFRQVAFPYEPDNSEQYFARYFAGPGWADFRRAVMTRRERLGEFCAFLADRYRLAEADLVGFSSMFMQTVPSLAMATVIKDLSPETVTVMGGANCETPMGATLIEHATQLDFVFSGPSLRTFPRFLRALIDDDLSAAHTIGGVVSRKNCHEPRYRRAIGADTDVDDLVEPDYASFADSFTGLNATVEDPVEPILFFETSRGCWWGERSHCTFCGLNGQNMGYRSMSAENAVRQFERLFEYAPWCTTYSCTDNIMPLEYLTDVLPKLDPPPGSSIFYEVKVGLDQQDMAEMARAGVTKIQPGIEALATGTLKLMKKGSSAFQNLQLLKNCVRYGISPAWNLLIGFPGEPESTFEKYVADLPLLTHLPPPEGVFPVRFDRYSPYFNNAEEFGLDLHPVDHYGLTYPFPEESLRDLAYYFNDRSFSPYLIAVARWLRPLAAAVSAWCAAWEDDGRRPELRLEEVDGGWEVYDSRRGTAERYPLDPATAEVLLTLERPTRLDRLGAELPHVEGVAERVAELRHLGLVFVEGERAMSLIMAETGVDPLPRPRRSLVSARRRLPITVS
ncbi:RiPP maturation radical SAM C-methyltransferase [Acrocarpospora catenulata]|uniref:RiPP maturation radical SAM C-methyltransferase n=1 Tax=Acrocarpospora catenulata TaxID=2836182 RepID=UPI001BDB30FA|nr:RiPP maturation radical SAM C-methyltransferase [Acrocarpospora catenulata]